MRRKVPATNLHRLASHRYRFYSQVSLRCDLLPFSFSADRAVTHRSTCCFTTARVTSETRAREDRERAGGCHGCMRISKTRNCSVAINHSPVGRSVGRLTRFVSRPPCAPVRCLISLSDFERRCRCACTTISLSFPLSLPARNDRHRLTCTCVPHGGPRAWADAAPCYAHDSQGHTRARSVLRQAIVPPVHSLRDLSSHPPPPVLPRITILIAVKVPTSDLSGRHRSIADEAFPHRRAACGSARGSARCIAVSSVLT